MKHLVSILLSSLLFIGCMQKSQDNPIRYVALGDSYTIGQSVNESERWPNLLTEELNTSGINIELVENPSRTGWTSQHVIDYELPVMIKQQADFVTLLIGVNDYVQGVPIETFENNISIILDQVLKQVKTSDRVVVITIPDFGVTPAATYFDNPQNISSGIHEFNLVLTRAAKQRNIAVADIYEVSQGMTSNSGLVLDDGIHPSPAEYVLWKQAIYPIAYSTISKK